MEEFEWTDELTLKFIEIRREREQLFNGKRNVVAAYKGILKEMRLEGILTVQQLKKKWHNLVTKYKDLKKAGTGHGVDEVYDPAITWQFFKLLDEHLGCRPIDRSYLISSSDSPTPYFTHDTCSPISNLTPPVPSQPKDLNQPLVPDVLLPLPTVPGANSSPSSLSVVTSSSLTASYSAAEASSTTPSSRKQDKVEEILEELIDQGREKLKLMSALIDIVVNKKLVINRVNEYGIKLLVDSAALSPKKSGAFYNKEISVSRALVVAALAAYIESGKSVLMPIRVLDGIGATGILGLLLRKQFDGTQVEVTINDPNEESCSFVKNNAKLNDLEIEVTNKDTCAVMHERAFNFIYLDCHTSAAQYFDAAFRNIPKRGVFIVTTSDDSALYGRTPEIALRNYGGKIVKTAYFKELAIRLVLAGMARSAARFNKAIKVLCTMSVKASFTVVVEVVKGAARANDCLQMVQSMIHCSFCEDWVFLPKTQYPIENPTNLLRCDCRQKCPGKTASCIGPIWSGPIFNSDFISAMLGRLSPRRDNDELISPLNCQSILSLLGLLQEEALCRKSHGHSLDTKREAGEDNGTIPKRLRSNEWVPEHAVDEISNDDKDKSVRLSVEESETGINCDPEAAPAFYLSLHRRVSGRGGDKVPRADSAVTRLREAGFRASRTHFDPYAIRTNALPSDMRKLLGIK